MANDEFDEEFYRKSYPDVALAIAHGAFLSGWDHYQKFGKAEGRLPRPRQNPGTRTPAAVRTAELGGANLGYSEGWDPGAFDCPAPLPRHKEFLQRFARRNGGDCIEIGCYPGTYLTVFGELGYTLHGIDFTPRVPEVERYLSSLGYRVGSIELADFRTMSIKRTYDLVYSLGFIEHFTSWHDILVRHTPLVSDGGTLIVGAPNMAGIFQRVLWRYFDPKTYEEHYVPSMSAEHWKAVLELLGFEVQFCGITWGCDLLTGDSGLTNPGKMLLFRFMQQIAPYLVEQEELNTPATGYYAAVVAKKVQPGDPLLIAERPEVRKRLAEIAQSAIERDAHIDQAADGIIRALDVLTSG